MLRIINGFVKPKSGAVTVLSRRINGYYRNELRKKVAYIPQTLGLVENMTVLENVLLAKAPESPIRALLGRWRSSSIEEALLILEEVGLKDMARRKVSRLSGGERQRVAIARAVMQQASLILADEPVANLDHHTASSILELLVRLSKRGVTIIIVIHDEDLAARFIGEAYVLSGGSFLRTVS